MEYSWPGTSRSKLGRPDNDEPWTKNKTGRACSPCLGASLRFRYKYSRTLPFSAQYSLLQYWAGLAFVCTAETVFAARRPAPMFERNDRREEACIVGVLYAEL